MQKIRPLSSHLQCGLNPYDVMPFPIQTLCIATFAPKTPVLRLYPDHTVKINDRKILDKAYPVHSRFLLMWKDKHVICCRIDHGRTGKQCILMDTCSTECPDGSSDLVDFIRCSEKLPMHIRNANLDIFCDQQRQRSGGCTVMSIINATTKTGEQFSSVSEGEGLRIAFAMRYSQMTEEDKRLLAFQWEDAFSII